MKLGKEEWIAVLGIVAVGSFIFSFIQGWLAIHFMYFLALLGVITVLFGAWHTKSKKTVGVDKAYDTALPILQKFKLASDSGASLSKFFRVPDNKRFSTSGKIWELEFKGNPGSHVVLIDAKTGKVVGGEFYGPQLESPMTKPWTEPAIYRPQIGKYKKEVKEEVRPE